MVAAMDNPGMLEPPLHVVVLGIIAAPTHAWISQLSFDKEGERKTE
jgi:hypothetical protein